MILGIDLGTSSLKAIGLEDHTVTFRSSYVYRQNSVEEWLFGLCRLLKEAASLGNSLEGIGLSSQVGTYVVNNKEILSWQEQVGKEELTQLKKDFTSDDFIREISMPCPEILSYPVPRILYLKKKSALEGKKIENICQPKEILIQYLTGKQISDPYSWRGLANLHSGRYSSMLLDYMQISEDLLPPLLPPFHRAGAVCAKAASFTGIREGTPVCIGCNDFYASLAGMGITGPGQCFDVTGTSEHLGIIQTELTKHSRLVSSPYFHGNVHYGVTASTGASLDFAIRRYHLKAIHYKDFVRKKQLPLFLPYLNGERAPIFDGNARGVFFGIGKDTTEADMAYAVMEGTAFSIKHIFEELSVNKEEMPAEIIASGGAAANPELNQLKADLFGTVITRVRENDTSALGAALIAGIGSGKWKDLKEAASEVCHSSASFLPEENAGLFERFSLYKQLYKDLKNDFEIFRRL